MILTGPQIIEQRRLGKIVIEPFDSKLINPNSYNYRLGKTIFEANSNPIDPKSPLEKRVVELDKSGYVLEPGKFYLGSTYEEIGSDHYTTILIGRSSLGRLGLFLQICSDLGHIGTRHCWTLELTVVQPLKIYPLMKIGQISFWVNKGRRPNQEDLYRNKFQSYAHFSDPRDHIISKFWQ